MNRDSIVELQIVLLVQLIDILKKGLNYYSYDLAIDSTNIQAYQNYLNENKEKDASEIKIEKRDSGKYYLQAGKYNVIVTDNASGTSVKKELIISKPKHSRHSIPEPEEK